MENRPQIRLTQTVKKGGCAAKVAATELRKILSQVSFPPASPELLVDGRHFDDAAIYKVSETTALVQTIDFFTPILDSPFDFGRVAAANALSDVYAMGGRPVTALAVLAFPLAELPSEVVVEVLQGASETVGRARASFCGGHSIDDDTLKFGLSVTGLVHPERVWANTGARAGDTLILTKGLGTGTLTAALKRDAITEDDLREAVESMATLNNAIDALEPAGLTEAVHAATDVTGFGFSGHSTQMARASQMVFEIEAKSLPRLHGAEDFLKREFLTKAHRSNRDYTSPYLDASPLEAHEQLLLHDPQTSGGLLLSVDSQKAADVVRALKPRFPKSSIVGHVRAAHEETEKGRVIVR